MKLIISTCFASFVFLSFSQNNYGFVSVLDIYKSKTNIEIYETGELLNQPSKYGGRFDLLYLKIINSKITLKSDISFFPSLITLWYNKKNNIPYNSAIFDINAGRVFNHKRPISIGPVDTRIGMGLNLGLKLFDNNYGQIYGANSFIAYGLSLNTIIDFGDNFQLFYLNTFNFAFNPRYSELYRTMHEVYFMYKNNWKFRPSIAPYIETFRYKESSSNEKDNQINKSFIGIKFGVTGTF